MATSSYPSPIIFSIGDGSQDPNINKAIEDRIKELLEKFKDTKSIVYVNFEKLIFDPDHTPRERSTTRSRPTRRCRSRGHSRSRSRSRSRSPSHQRNPRHHHGQPIRGHGWPMHCSFRGRHHQFHHFGDHQFPPFHYSPEMTENNWEFSSEEDRAFQHPWSRCEDRGRRGWFRMHSMSRLDGNRGKCRKGKCCPKQKDNVQTTESEDQEVVMINEDEPKNPVNEEEHSESEVDDVNSSQAQ